MNPYYQAAQVIKNSQILLITAGAGIGVDSGLPDFRGDKGFWNAYKPFKDKYTFRECASPIFQKVHPKQFWGFYGHRQNLYNATKPHEGFNILMEMSKDKKNYFVVTSNVDGQFQKAGFNEEKILEVHGSIHYYQCNKCKNITSAKGYRKVKVDEEKFEAQDDIPVCKRKTCQSYQLRPNILMFGDWDWIEDRSIEQSERYAEFIKSIDEEDKIAIVEIGAGMKLPYICTLSESIFEDAKYKDKAQLIRINPTDLEANLNEEQIIKIQDGSLKALREIRKNY